MTEVIFDASEIEQLGRAIGKLPGEIKAKAMASAMRRMTQMARTQVIKQSALRTDLPPSRVRRITTAHFNAGGNTIEVVEKSGWIPLYDLGPRQTKTGVTTRYRGSYASAFIARMGNGHAGVMKRAGKARIPIRELFGPNPAHDVTNNPDEFIKVLASIIEDHLAPRVLHEIGRLLPG
ncbi:hypothetical protein [Rhizobium metallidurans]|uniref:Uncharacterized protein n=1 Tax=Rhizobium metallidurans TaxID=1265931 RepID=A0A7W6CRP3_9HYPH|nr:hypothetical protein [Rhizobium metallidurans]MBB3965940.1 hypothetical protein [Rhizobium metallidurans]